MCDHDQDQDDPESIKALEEIQIRVLLLDELAALSDYTRALGWSVDSSNGLMTSSRSSITVNMVGSEAHSWRVR